MPVSPPQPANSGQPARVACAGLVVVDHVTPPLPRMPRAGELVAVDGLVLNIGGGAANTAADLARLGVPTSICARVGDDIFGQFAARTLVAHGVDVRDLLIGSEHETSQTLIVNVKGEDRRFIHSVGANREFTPEDLDPVLDRAPSVLYIGYFLLMPRLDPSGLAARFARARKAGTITFLDVATPGPGDYLGPIKAVLPHTDLFVPNTDEAALILGEEDPVRQALAFHEMGARRVVVTCGERGAVSVSAENRLRVGVYPTQFVDGSGGGDAFNAGYIAGLLDDLSEEDCLRLASAAGASCVRAVGTTAGVFTRGEAEDFMARHRLAIETLS
ncbi:putative sugar kinase YdjH [Aquisphaera giovannonii]|uniref:Putative sugar kinase YdjH n=1 Tax=Aquisphaera giovannonii TaxID=406548 RepID=A0A5B9WA73_9BACT|nr:carbohydrate kinase family protein [Aquisphaera giovannonii]QEH37528.1 putative sugar kinase YdjH [Aquisphaera giovannonii]